MNIDELIQLITSEVIKNLKLADEHHTNESKGILLLGSLQDENYIDIYDNILESNIIKEIQNFDSYVDVDNFDYIIVPYLNSKEMVNITLGIDEGVKTKAVIDAILLGKKIFVIEEGIYYKKFKQSSNKNFYAMLEENENKLGEFGICIVKKDVLVACLNNPKNLIKDENKKENENDTKCSIASLEHLKVITESHIENIFKQGYREICVGEKTIISPLAVDYIKSKDIVVIGK